MEIEAKFAIPNRDVYRALARLETLGGFSLAPVSIVRMIDRYFDTVDGLLLAAGYTCRHRQAGEQTLVTLKGLGRAEGAIHRREEIEAPLETWSPDPSGWAAGELRTLLIELIGTERLQPLFELSQERSRADLLDGQRWVGQLSLDAVRAAVGARPALYYELEAELAATGTEADLERLARALEAEWGLTIEPRSKFERALDTLRLRGSAVEDRLTADERAAVEAIAGGADAELARRAGVVLGWADGCPTREIIRRTGLSDGRVRHWLRAFRAGRMEIFGAPAELPVERPPADVTAPVAATPPAPHPKAADPPIPAAAIKPVALPPPSPPPTALPASPPPVAPAEKRSGDEPPSVVAFCRTHQVQMSHAQHVASQARQLFGPLRSMHRLPRKRRRLLKLAALLCTVGAEADPERPHRAGRDLILAQPLRGVSTAERRALACIIAFTGKKVKPEREPAMQALEARWRPQVLTLAAILRVAEALDLSHTQTTRIVSVELLDGDAVEVTLSGPFAAVDAAQATGAAKLWRRLFHGELLFKVRAGEPGVSLPQPVAPPEEAMVQILEPRPGPAESSTATKIPVLSSDQAMSEAGRSVMLRHFQRMLDNEAGTRLGEEIEALHDMRVSTRRLRAAFRLFEPFYERRLLRPFGRSLRTLGITLGAVRDLDVLLAKAALFGAGLPAVQAPSLEPLFARWRAVREIARRELLEQLESASYREFVSGFGRLLTTPGEGAARLSSDDPKPFQVRHVAPSLILAHYETVRAYELLLPGAPLPIYHRLRIDCKRLRYAMEFFGELLGPGGAPLIKQVTAMQDLLGELQDARVALDLLADYAGERAAQSGRGDGAVDLPAVASYIAYQRGLEESLQGQFPEPWRALVGAEFRRALGRAVAEM